ncbi:MAG TPA: putative lipid II flippase FtsW [Candidatus Acidoferrales bacterium]|jgi:cell division protein FtsW|nr:putative lipid II flippase FtsW [Candidatus Acidoferrales bacterium]
MKAAVTILAFCVAALLALGLVMLYSSSMVMYDRHTHAEVGARMLQMQMLWCALGVIACIVVAAVDYEILKKFAWPIFGATLLLAILVFVPHLGMKINGARRWIHFPGASFQPSEIVKIGLIIMLAWYVDHSQRKMNTFVRGIIYPGIIIGLALGLIFIEPDRGTTILLAGVTGTMLFLAGVRWLHLIPVGVAGVAALAVSIAHDGMRSGRISAWLHPQSQANGVGLQAELAKIAIGSGGLTGLGLGDGRQKLGFLPEIHSDFIFANIGEELGLVATGFVVIAFLIIAICGIYIAMNARDQFGSQLAIGVTSLISFQAIINIGVVTSLLPNKGLALPFISSGGSSLLAMLIAVGILLSVARRGVTNKIPAGDFAANENPFAARRK